MVENSDMVFIPDIATAVVDPFIEAPVTIGYAMANRSAVVRIPAYVKSPDKKRFELRNPDATCNPYYAYAAILMADLDGIRRKIDPAGQNWGPDVYKRQVRTRIILQKQLREMPSFPDRERCIWKETGT